jgi:hypothetical protein
LSERQETEKKIVAMSWQHGAMVVVVAALVGTLGADAEIDFRPPAIPLFTTDPFMQTW